MTAPVAMIATPVRILLFSGAILAGTLALLQSAPTHDHGHAHHPGHVHSHDHAHDHAEHNHDVPADGLPAPGLHLISFEAFLETSLTTGAVPPDLARLNGAQVGIVGFAVPVDGAFPFREFYLTELASGCCAEHLMHPAHSIRVALEPDLPALGDELAPLKVEGVFRIAPEFHNGELSRLYWIEATRAEYLHPDP